MRLAAALLLLAAPCASAAPRKAKAKPQADKPAASRPFGVVTRTSSRIAPGADGPVFRDGKMSVLRDRADFVEEFKATPRTKVTLDGKPAKFKAVAAGAVVLRADFDEKTKELSSVDLKSGPKPDGGEKAAEAPEALPGPVEGEVAGIDVIKGSLSVRVGRQSMRDLLVDERTRIAGESGSALEFTAIKIGDGISAQSKDGKTADEILVRIPR